MAGPLGQDTDVLKLDVVVQVYDVYDNSQFLWMIKIDMLMVLHGPGLSGMPGLSSVDFPQSQEMLYYSKCF
jgi:hypothetical protein